MNILLFMIPLAIILAGVFVGGFIWAALSGQYDDLETPSFRILDEEENNLNKESTSFGRSKNV